MTSKFEKVIRPPLGDFDGFDQKTLYQMIPVGGRRDMGVITGDRECLLRVNNPSVANIANLTPPLPFPRPGLTTDRVIIPKNSRLEFSIFGKIAGATELILEENGAIQDALLISVKDKLKRNYALCSLADVAHKSSRTSDDAIDKMRNVAKTFLQQSNVELELRVVAGRNVTDVVVPKNLGNPIFVARQPDIFSDVVGATPAELFGGSPPTIIVYCVSLLSELAG